MHIHTISRYQDLMCFKMLSYVMHMKITIQYMYRLKAAKMTDKRVRVMNEIISGMRLIKMYAWEWAFHEHVKKIRKLV